MEIRHIALATAAAFAVAAPAAFAASTQYHSDKSDSGYSSGMTNGADRSDSTYNRGVTGTDQNNRSDTYTRGDQAGKSDRAQIRDTTHSAGTVRKVQQALQDQGYNPGPIDGVFGPKTRAALVQYQELKGIRAKGQINPQTLAELNVNSGSSPQMMDNGKDTGSPMQDQNHMKGKNQGS
jgi:murein L,D-transpeptidase YcbB/YkuD